MIKNSITVTVLFGLFGCAIVLVPVSASNTASICNRLDYKDPECRSCCVSNGMVGVPDQYRSKKCECIEAELAEEYAMRHKINLLETKREKEACNGLAARSDECKFCCQQRLRTAQTSSVRSLLNGGACRCTKQFKVKYHSDGSAYVDHGAGGGGSSGGWMGGAAAGASGGD